MGKGGDGSAVVGIKRTSSIKEQLKNLQSRLATKSHVNQIQSDLTVLKHLWLKTCTEEDLSKRLEEFYGPQAHAYDGFRSEFLWGRKPLLAACAARLRGRSDLIWVDVGGGTGENVALMSEYMDLNLFHHIYVVDLCPSLCKQAQSKVDRYGWSNVTVMEGDATEWRPPSGMDADLVTFSYSLSMMPEFHAAVDTALTYMEPMQGLLGVTDFFVSGRTDLPLRRMPWALRFFWRAIFDTDHIDIGPERRAYLDHRLCRVWEANWEGSIPYVPLLRVPYYVWLGRACRRGRPRVEAKVERPPRFPPTFLYTQSWEDPAADAPHLGITASDVCLTLTSGGCNSLELCLAGAAAVYSVDCNPAQSALLELKATACAHLPHDDVWALFGEGRHPNVRALYERHLAPHLSQAALRFWGTRLRYFDDGLYFHGGMGRVVWVLQLMVTWLGMRPKLEQLAHAPDLAAQISAWDRLWDSSALAWLPAWMVRFAAWVVTAILFNPVTLWLGGGIPVKQRQLIARDGVRLSSYAARTFSGIARNSHVRTENYFYLNCLTGKFGRDNCPAYLTVDGHRQLQNGALDVLHIVTGYLLSSLCERVYTKVVLMDHMDWLPQSDIQKLADALGMHVAPGGKVIWRSAALEAPYAADIAKAGFQVERIQNAVDTPYMDRVNMYSSFYVATKM